MPYDIGNNNIALPPVDNYRPNYAAISIGQTLGNLLRAPSPDDEYKRQQIIELKRKEADRAKLIALHADNPDVSLGLSVYDNPNYAFDLNRGTTALNPQSTDAQIARSVVASGGLIGENQGVSLADRERVAGRNSSNSLSNSLVLQNNAPRTLSERQAELFQQERGNFTPDQIAKATGAYVEPINESQFKAQQLQENLPTATPEEKSRLLYGNPPSGGIVTSFDENGRPVISVGGAAAQKAQAAEKSKSNIDYLTDSAAAKLKELSDLGGMATQGSETGQRIVNQLQTAPIPGNERLQRVLDPKSAALRDELRSMRSLMLSEYRTAANIPASASNSDIEQKNLKDALPDPDGVDYETNLQRIKNFQAIYGALKSGQLSLSSTLGGVAQVQPSAAPKSDNVDLDSMSLEELQALRQRTVGAQ